MKKYLFMDSNNKSQVMAIRDRFHKENGKSKTTFRIYYPEKNGSCRRTWIPDKRFTDYSDLNTAFLELSKRMSENGFVYQGECR